MDGEKLKSHQAAVNSQGQGQKNEGKNFQSVGIAASEEQDQGEKPEKKRSRSDEYRRADGQVSADHLAGCTSAQTFMAEG